MICKCGCGKEANHGVWITGHWNKVKGSWNKGLTKDTDERVLKNARAVLGTKHKYSVALRNKHHAWNGGCSPETYRSMAFEDYKLEEICNTCGSTKYIVIHHKNTDRHDNSKDNLEVLCKSCHQKLHNKKPDRMHVVFYSKQYPNIQLKEEIHYNPTTGSFSCNSHFRSYNGIKLVYILETKQDTKLFHEMQREPDLVRMVSGM